MNSPELQGNIDSETLSTIANNYNSVYNSHSCVDAVRNLVLKTLNNLQQNQFVNDNVKVYKTWDFLQEYYNVDFPNGGSLRLKMASYRPVCGWSMTVKHPHTFLQFNKLIEQLENKINNANQGLSPIITCFRELIAIAGEGFVYEVDHEDSFFNILFTKAKNFHAIELEVNLN